MIKIFPMPLYYIVHPHIFIVVHYNIIGDVIMLYRPQNEEGQGLVEYALILVLVAVVVVVILTLLGPSIGNLFSNLVWNLKYYAKS
jgi:pilus assembly protein Flp/PilA